MDCPLPTPRCEVKELKAGRHKIEFDLEILKGLAEIQCTYQEIAAVFNVSTETIERRMKNDTVFCALVKKGYETGKTSLRRKQYEKAIGGNTTMLIWLGKQYLGQTDKQDVNATGDLTINVTHKDD